MTRQSHDQFAKQYLEELLSPLGLVQTSYDIASEVRQVDVWFVPTPAASPAGEWLGLLGKMALPTCIFEPFRNPPTPAEVRNCQLKLYSIHGEIQRGARQDHRARAGVELPFLWILSPSCSPRLINGFGAKEDLQNWGKGVYFLPEHQKTALVAINQLPEGRNRVSQKNIGSIP